MPKYEFLAYDVCGGINSGRIEADDLELAQYNLTSKKVLYCDSNILIFTDKIYKIYMREIDE